MKRLIFVCLLLSATVYSQDSKPKHLIKFLESNSSHSDYAASFFGEDHLVFSTPIEDKGKNPKQDLFIAKFDESGQISDPKILGFENRTATKTGFTLSADHQTVYFSAKNKRKGKHQLFKASIDKDGLWTNIVRLPFNDSRHHFTSPTLSPDNTKLYFASDNRQSYGGTDIFVVTIEKDGTMGQPVNLGDLINTAGNEVTPFVSESNVLYYSSDGFQASKGGFDIYKSQITEDGFTEPEDMDAPINGPHNDVAYIINSSNSKGYFSSNRLQGDENNNIYSFLIDHPVVENCEQIIAGVVKDKVTTLPISGAEMILLDSTNEEVSRLVTDQTGAYSFTMECNTTYTLIATGASYDKEEHIINTANYRNAPALAANKFLTKSLDAAQGLASNDTAGLAQQNANQQQQASDITNINTTEDDVLNQSGEASSNNLKSTMETLPSVNAIYFDFDKAYIKQTARPQLDEIVSLMKDNPEVTIELSAYTDSRGPKAYNLFLSQRRLKSTMKYLISQGISKERLTGEGYGEANIINQCTDGVPCSREDHRKNRRTEFNFISNNAIVRLEKKKAILKSETAQLKPKPKVESVAFKAKDPIKIVQETVEKPTQLSKIQPIAKEKKEVKVIEKRVVNEANLVNADTGTTTAEIKALLDEGVIVESTTVVGDDQVTPKKEPIKEIIKTPIEAKVAPEKKSAELINIEALANNQEDYDRLIKKGVIEEQVVNKSANKKASPQSSTSEETYKRLEEMRINKENAEAKKTTPAPKTLGNSSSRPFDQASASEEYEPNEMIKIVNKNVSEAHKTTPKTGTKAGESAVKVNTVTVTPMTSKRGKYVSTDRAKKIQALRVNFSLLSNSAYTKGYQDAYIVIRSPEGAVINQTGTFELSSGEEMGFTEQTTVLFNNQDLKVVMFIDRIIQKFVKGNYTVDIYFNGTLSASTNLAIAS